MSAYVWATSSRAQKAIFLAEILDLPLMIDAPLGDCDLVHVVGMVDSPTYSRTLAYTARADRRVVHWTGRDTLMAFESERLAGATHACETEQAVATLASTGLDAVLAPWPVRPNVEPTPLPADRRVAAYIGADPYDFCLEVVRSIDQAMPDVEIVMYHRDELDDAALADLVRSSRAHLRLASRDTDMHSARVFLEAGRRVLMSNTLEHATIVPEDDLPRLVSTLDSLLEEAEPDYEAASHWREINDEQWFRARIEEVL